MDVLKALKVPRVGSTASTDSEKDGSGGGTPGEKAPPATADGGGQEEAARDDDEESNDLVKRKLQPTPKAGDYRVQVHVIEARNLKGRGGTLPFPPCSRCVFSLS
jgi:hypothetical protein